MDGSYPIARKQSIQISLSNLKGKMSAKRGHLGGKVSGKNVGRSTYVMTITFEVALCRGSLKRPEFLGEDVAGSPATLQTMNAYFR